MEVIIAVLAVVSGLAVAFFRGKATGETEEKIDALKKTAAQTEKVKESDHAVNSKDRAELVNGLLADSLRSPSEKR